MFGLHLLILKHEFELICGSHYPLELVKSIMMIIITLFCSNHELKMNFGFDMESPYYNFIIIGPRRSGKTTLVTFLAKYLLKHFNGLLICAPKENLYKKTFPGISKF